MRKNVFYFFILFIPFLGISQVGIKTNMPTKDLDVNGELRVREIPATDMNEIESFLAADGEGNIKSVPPDFFNKNVAGILYDIVYLQGTNSITIPLGTTQNIPGLELHFTIPKGQKKILMFTISGSVRGAAGAASVVGQGVFGLYDETNTKITFGYVNFTDLLYRNDNDNANNNGRLLNAPMPVSFQKQVVLDNTNGTADIAKIYTVKYTAWATRTLNSNTAHLVNFVPTDFVGYQEDTEALLSKMTVLIFNMN